MSETIPENESAVWASDGPFKMSSERPRELAWITSGGQTGIVGPSSLEVKAQLTPDGTVRILPGSFSAVATPDGVAGYPTAPWQSYGRGIPSTTTVAITPTDSSGSRVDVVGIEVVDPVYEGTTDTVDWETHQFWRPRVIENASTTAVLSRDFGLARPFVPLARITIPASTSTIYDEDIDDLRFLAVEQTFHRPVLLTAPERKQIYADGSHTNLGQFTTGVIPQWATHMVVDAEIGGARSTGQGEIRGRTWMVIKQPGGPNVEMPRIDWQVPVVPLMFSMPVMGEMEIRPEDRGREMEMWFRIEATSGDASVLISEGTTAMRVRLTFQQRTIRG